MWLIVSLVVGVSLIISACAPAAPAPGVPEVPEEKPVMITIAGGSMGSTTYFRANAIAGIFKEWMDIDTTVIIYPSMAQMASIHDGIVDLAVGTYPHEMGPAYAGSGDYAGDPYRDLRVLFTAADCPQQIFVAVDSPYETFRDLIGERISAGKNGTLTEDVYSRICEALGLSLEKDFDTVFLGHPESAAAMIAGKIVSYATPSAPPQPAFTEIDLTYAVRLIGYSKEDLATIIEKIPTFLVIEIPPIWYHMDKPVVTCGPLSVVTASDRMPEDIAYGLVKNFIENPEFVGYYHSALQSDIEEGRFKHWVENANVGAPYHIGAYRYFKEVGWNVPAEMIPPEAK
jgi:hypothetical protein